MSEYVFRYASGFGCDMSALMDGGRETVGEYFASDAIDHYGTLHEEVVRCRDCRRFRPRESSLLSCRFELDNGLVQWRYAEPDGFCKWSDKKKEVGE